MTSIGSHHTLFYDKKTTLTLGVSMRYLTQQYNLIFKLISLFSLVFLSGCHHKSEALENLEKLPSRQVKLTDNSEEIKLFLANTAQTQAQGLSDLMDDEFHNDWAMLFPGIENEMKNFWMPSTYFNLDLIYLTKDFYIIDIERNLQHFKHRLPETSVPRARAVWAYHVLEMKASSPISQKLKVGDHLTGLLNLQQKEPNILQRQ